MRPFGTMDARTLLGFNIRRLRVPRGLSQERLALEAKIDRAYVGRIERGMENVTIDTVEILAKALGVPVGALLEAAPDDAVLLPVIKAGRKPRVVKHGEE